MRAEIHPDGTLKLVPETTTEAYALRRWIEGYDRQESCIHAAWGEHLDQGEVLP